MNRIWLLLPVILLLLFAFNIAEKSTSEENTLADDQLEVLLIGTSHWANYKRKGLDVAQTNQVDILSDQYQNELEFIADKIAAFKPDKIFVERTLDYQPKLDSLYKLYSASEEWGADKRNEIYQLGFRVAAKLEHERVYGVDYRNTSFPFDSLMKAMAEAKQETLIGEFQETIKSYEEQYNALVEKNTSLVEIFNQLNDKEARKKSLGWYITEVSKAGKMDNYIGPFLGSEWIRRNLYTYSLIQKYVEEEDERIMILMGAGHTAVLDNFISYNPDWKIVELAEVVQ